MYNVSIINVHTDILFKYKIGILWGSAQIGAFAHIKALLPSNTHTKVRDMGHYNYAIENAIKISCALWGHYQECCEYYIIMTH